MADGVVDPVRAGYGSLFSLASVGGAPEVSVSFSAASEDTVRRPTARRNLGPAFLKEAGDERAGDSVVLDFPPTNGANDEKNPVPALDLSSADGGLDDWGF